MKPLRSSRPSRRTAARLQTKRTNRAFPLAALLSGIGLFAAVPQSAQAQNYVFTDLTPSFLNASSSTSAFPAFDFFGGYNRAALLRLFGSGDIDDVQVPTAYLGLTGTEAVNLKPTAFANNDGAEFSSTFGNLLLGSASEVNPDQYSHAVVWNGLSGALATKVTPAFLGSDGVSMQLSGFDYYSPRFVGVGGEFPGQYTTAIYWGYPTKAAGVNIHPSFLAGVAGAESQADFGAASGVLFGVTRTQAAPSDHAVLWKTPTSGGAVNMHPSFAGASGSSAVEDEIIAGTRYLGTWSNGTSARRPVVWTGYSNTSAQDLTPAFLGANPGATANALNTVALYGYGSGSATGGNLRALYWSSYSAASAVDITPAFLGATATATVDYDNAFISAAAGVTPYLFGQGSGAATANKPRAIVWKGATAASAVDMTPAFLGASPTSTLSFFSGIFGGFLNGSAIVGEGAGAATGNRNHAIAWTTASAASGIDLHPTFVDAQGNSTASSVYGSVILGAWTSPTLGSGNSHAVVWRGLNKSSAVDLHLQLPAAFRTAYPSSSAFSIDHDGNIFGSSSGIDINTGYKQRSWVLKPVGLTSRQIGAGSDNRGRLLWNHSDGRVYLMSVNDASGALSPSVALSATPGGYTARAFAQGRVDGKTRILLTSSVNGAAKVQTIGVNQTSIEATYTFNAPAGYRFTDISVGNDNKVRLLLSNVNGASAVWRLGLTGAIELGNIYGPYLGYVPGGIGTGTDNKTRIAYVYGNGTQIAYHTLGVTGVLESGVVVKAPLNYTYGGFTLGADNKARLLWDAFAGGCAVWRMNAAGSAPEIGKAYGPILGYAAQGISVSPDGITRLMWKNYDRRTAYWTLDTNLNVTKGYTYGPYN